MPVTCPACGATNDVPAGGVVLCFACGGRIDSGSGSPAGSPPGVTPVAATVWRLIGIAALLVSAGAAIVMVTRSSSSNSSPAPTATTAAARGDAGTTALADVETGPVTLVWHAKVHTETGEKPLTPGTPCTLTQVVVHGTKRNEVSTQLLTFQCEGRTLYDSSAAMAGMASTSGTLEELPVPGELHAYEYTTKQQDTGARSGDRNQITVSTRDGTVEAFRDTPPAFRVKATIDEFTAPRQGKPLYDDDAPAFDDVVRRVATVTTRSGAVPFTASHCDLTISPGGAAHTNNCRVLLTCGGKLMFGGGTVGFEKCTMSQGEPVSLVDSQPTPKDKDPELSVDLVAGSATLGDTLADGATYTVAFKLARP